MKRAVFLITAALGILGSFAAHGSFSGENFTVNLRGDSREARVIIHSSGERINLEGNFTVSRDEGIITAEISPRGDMPLYSQPNLRAGGSLKAEIETAGKDGIRPVSGNITGEALFFDLPEAGVFSGKGSLRASISEDIITVESLEFNDRGRAGITGKINFQDEEPSAEISLELEEYPLLRRADRSMKISGTGNLRRAGSKTYAEGSFTVDSADIYIRDADTAARPAEDIKVIGEENPPPPSYPVETASLDINLGDNFRIRTNELDAEIEGELRLETDEGGDLSVFGSVRAIQGSYKAYGQEMYIERAVITFTGPPDNPGLNVLALHKHRNIDVGVKLSGTLAAPKIELYSDPDMPDVEKLSILVLGRSFETAGGGDMSLIAASAAAILAPEEYAKLESELLKMTGLDEIRLAPGEDREKTVVILGKQLSSRLNFKYKRGLAGFTNAAILEYFLTLNWLVRAETGYDNLIGLTYSIAFD